MHLNKKYFKLLLSASLISAAVFIILTFFSYFLHLKFHTNFRVGLPWTFYYQFIIECEIQHGSDLFYLLADYFVTWVAVFLLLYIFKKISPAHKSKKKFILNANKFSDLKSFYIEVDKLFTKGIIWQTGHNLDSFNDLLLGGFGVFEYKESIEIYWKNYPKSISDLASDLAERLVQIIQEHHHIDLFLGMQE